MQFIPKLYEDDGSTDTGERDVPPPPLPFGQMEAGSRDLKTSRSNVFLVSHITLNRHL